MSNITFVYKVSRFVSRTGQLLLSEYPGANEDVKSLAQLHTRDHHFLSGLMMATVEDNGDKVTFTFNRKVHENDVELSEAVSKARISWSTNFDPSLLEGLDFEQFTKVPCNEDTGVSTLTGWQLHVTIPSPDALKTQSGVWTKLKTVNATSIRLVQFGEPDYLKVGDTVNISDFNEVYFNVRQKGEKLSSDDIKNQARASLKRVSSRSRKGKPATTSMSVDSIESAGSLMDQLNAAAAAVAPQVKADEGTASTPVPTSTPRTSRFSQGGTL